VGLAEDVRDAPIIANDRDVPGLCLPARQVGAARPLERERHDDDGQETHGALHDGPPARSIPPDPHRRTPLGVTGRRLDTIATVAIVCRAWVHVTTRPTR